MSLNSCRTWVNMSLSGAQFPSFGNQKVWLTCSKRDSTILLGDRHLMTLWSCGEILPCIKTSQRTQWWCSLPLSSKVDSAKESERI